MGRLYQQEEKELISFIKDWLKSHGFNQKELANELNIKSIQMPAIILKLKEFYKKGGMYNVAKNLIKICLLYTSPSPRDGLLSRMPSSA